MSPLNLKRVHDEKEKKNYWIYDNKKMKMQDGTTDAMALIPDDLVIFTPSGVYSGESRVPISWLHTAIRDINRLDTLEDHFLIYRIVRSPERRVFYIDPGNLPAKKAEQYLKQVISTYKSKKTFNESNGTIMNRNQHPSMLEDFFLLRRNGKGTEIDSVGSVGGIESIEDLLYFQQKATRALNVPFSRMNNEDRQSSPSAAVTGNEITREELKFSKFIFKLQGKFNVLFFELLRRQLVYKNIITADEWKPLKRKIKFVYKSDSQFADTKRIKGFEQKINILRDVEEYEGKWFTRKDIYTKILGLTDEEIKKHENEVQEEKTKYGNDEEDNADMMV